MPCSPSKRRDGYSLLELVLAIALVGGTLVPAMALLRDGVELSRTVDQRQLLANYAVQQLERRLAIVAANLPAIPSSGNDAGAITDTGIVSLRYEVTWSDSALAGGIPDQLTSVEATAYIDENADGLLDANEPQSTFRTKLAQLDSYAAEAAL